MIHCPKCNSTNWRCWDERNEYFADSSEEREEDQIFRYPVGYLACKDCGASWVDIDLPQDNIQHIGDDRQLAHWLGRNPDE